MIKLFNINDYKIDTAKFLNILHDPIVGEFEQDFADFVGAKYACSVSSATNAIFLSLLNKNVTIKVPSIIPPVVLNAILNSNNKIHFVDNIDWVGDSYVLHDFGDYKIIDSAQKVDKGQFIKEANDNDLMIFSFYPTKPIGSLDGGIIVSNDYDKIKWFKEAVMNGMTYANNNWERRIVFPGYKMYMSSIQAYVAKENMKKLTYKKEMLSEVREFYNKELGYANTSDHLYRISVLNNKKFIKYMHKRGIICGIHYEAAHMNDVYNGGRLRQLEKSEVVQNTTASIPFHENLTTEELKYIVKVIGEF